MLDDVILHFPTIEEVSELHSEDPGEAIFLILEFTGSRLKLPLLELVGEDLAFYRVLSQLAPNSFTILMGTVLLNHAGHPSKFVRDWLLLHHYRPEQGQKKVLPMEKG
ncbi:hypothetical protein U1Q18_027739 [Sarracenia purpurea var. burkii]